MIKTYVSFLLFYNVFNLFLGQWTWLSLFPFQILLHPLFSLDIGLHFTSAQASSLVSFFTTASLLRLKKKRWHFRLLQTLPYSFGFKLYKSPSPPNPLPAVVMGWGWGGRRQIYPMPGINFIISLSPWLN